MARWISNYVVLGETGDGRLMVIALEPISPGYFRPFVARDIEPKSAARSATAERHDELRVGVPHPCRLRFTAAMCCAMRLILSAAFSR